MGDRAPEIDSLYYSCFVSVVDGALKMDSLLYSYFVTSIDRALEDGQAPALNPSSPF
jgi:hypothetical protein